jgi:cobalt-zinc-cadmium efflux system outer membrane protein
MLKPFVLAAFLSGSATLWAASYSVESAVTKALRSNPDLQAARLTVEEARGRLLQSGRPANPEVESELKPNVRGREFSFSAGYMQKFPVTRRLWQEKAVSQAELDAAIAEVREAERQLAAQVRTAAVKVLAVQEAKAQKASQMAESKEVAKSVTNAAGAGEGSPIEAAQFEMEVSQLEVEILKLDGEKTALTGELRPLLGTGAKENVEITGSLVSPASKGEGSPDIRNRPDYQAAQARAEAARQNIILQQMNKWEDAGLGLSAEINRSEDAPDGLKTDGFIGVKFSIPLPFWNKNEGKIKEAQAAALRTAKEVDAIAARIRAEAAAASAEMRAAATIFAKTSDVLLPKAKELENRFMNFYRTAQPGALLADVLRSREKRIILETERLNALRDYHLAKARLRAALGETR